MPETFVRNEDEYPTPVMHPRIEVRSLGSNAFEARTDGGSYSAVGTSVNEAVAVLRSRLPAHREPVVTVVPLPRPQSDAEEPDVQEWVP